MAVYALPYHNALNIVCLPSFYFTPLAAPPSLLYSAWTKAGSEIGKAKT